jgi:hypothetical protein
MEGELTGLYFLQVIAAVVAANALTLWWAYSVWRINNNEKAGIEPHRGPFIYLVGGAVPPLVMALGAYFVTA